MSTPVRFSLLITAALTAACSGSPSFEPTYEACATDENWITFDDYEATGRVTASGSSIPLWVAPTPDATVSAAAAPVFQWQPSAGSAGTPDGSASCPQFQPAVFTGARGGLQVSHLPPVSGTVYDLHFAVDGSDAYRVVTTRQRASVPQNVLSGWSGKSVTATLYAAKMLNNSIVEGPFKAAPLRFQVTP